MPSWKGNPNNPVPNPVQEDSSLSEKRVDENRSFPIRRDTDTQKDQKITLMDIDKVIFDHLESMQFSVIDEGNIIKVPIFYGSPEKWVAAKRDGYLRDFNGKIQLPAMIFKRTNSQNDDDIEIFNRYVKYPVIQKNSRKNKYTQFSLLTNTNVPVHEVFNITMADHMVLTYNFIVWTEYHEQMNPIIEKVKFNTKDYWGTSRGLRFRCRTEGFSHTMELNSDDDRLVRTEFNLITNGYIVPESYQLLDRQYPTTEKLFTPKKIIMSAEIVSPDFDMEKLNSNLNKWRSKIYPNIRKGQEPTSPVPTWGAISDISIIPHSMETIVKEIRFSTSTPIFTTSSPATSPAVIRWRTVPPNSNSPGEEGWMAKDDSYLYVYSGGMWLRTPMSQFLEAT